MKHPVSPAAGDRYAVDGMFASSLGPIALGDIPIAPEGPHNGSSDYS